MASPLACQRHLFEMPAEVAYLDAAAWTPLPRSVREAGEAGMRVKSLPWAHPRSEVPPWTERARCAAAALIGAPADAVAVVGAVADAIAIAARAIAPVPGGRILRVAEEFPSLCLAFDRLAAEAGMVVEAVPRPDDGDWTAALLEAIARPGAPPLAVATLTPLHWADGTIIDLDRLALAVRAAGATLVVDATQAVGAMPIDVARLKPDFLAFPTYKWVLGPYSLAFLYAASHRQEGRPLAEHAGNRPPVTGARRYDRGECHDPVGLPMAATGLELVAGWGVPAIEGRLRDLTDRLAEGVQALGLAVPPRALRSPHILGVTVPGADAEDLVAQLRRRNVFVSARLGRLRISPHVFVDEADLSRVLAALEAVLPGRG